VIVIVDYGMGNLGSIANMLKKIGVKSIISSDPGAIRDARKLILPGVGAFDNAIKNLHELGLFDLLNVKVLQENVPILGICLGIQLFTKRSDEGALAGFGWIDAETVAFSKRLDAATHKIPHMGWNTVAVQKDNRLFDNMPDNPRFYFVHSFYVACNNAGDVLTNSTHGITFASSVQKQNIVGVQFHPEKSHKFGMTLLKNFVEWSDTLA
jgi:glutamine amidotransferase